MPLVARIQVGRDPHALLELWQRSAPRSDVWGRYWLPLPRRVLTIQHHGQGAGQMAAGRLRHPVGNIQQQLL